jgi:hypothetical protein
LFVFFFFFFFFCASQTTQDNWWKAQQSCSRVEAEEIWSLSFLPSASVSKKAAELQPAPASAREAEEKLQQRDRDRDRGPAGWPDETTGSRQANKKGRARIPTHPKTKSEGSWAGFFFGGGAPNNAFHLSSLMTIFIKKWGASQDFIFIFFGAKFSQFVIF